MTTPNLTQDSLIEALRQLRAVHPELPALRWEISPYPSVGLRGSTFSHDSDDAILAAFRAAIGGEISEAYQYVHKAFEGECLLQVLILRTTWADVPFVISGAVPVAAVAVSR